MKNIENVIEAPKIFEYLEKRQLLEQYKKAKNFLKSGETQKILFKQRQPKSMNLFQFRINKKFRAFGYIDPYDAHTFIVSKISDHQD